LCGGVHGFLDRLLGGCVQEAHGLFVHERAFGFV
jgi:hypothetical protein